MEDLLFYLIPIILILTYLFPKRKKKEVEAPEKVGVSKGEAENPKSGVFGKLNKMLEEYYQSDLNGSPARSRRNDPFAMGDEPYQIDEDEDEEAYNEDEDGETNGDEDGEKRSPSSATMRETKTEQKSTLESKKPETAKIDKPATKMRQPQGGQLSYDVTTVSKQDLRRAIVWSEILGRPVALRDKWFHQL